MKAKFVWVFFCVLSAFSALFVLSALCEKELGIAIFFAVLTVLLVLAAKSAEKKMKADSGKKTNVYLNEDFVKEFSEENAAPDKQTDVDKLFGGEIRKPLLGGAEKTAESPQKGDFADEVRKKIEDAQAAKKDAASDDDDEILFSALHASERRREEMAEKNQTENLYEIVYEDAKGDVTHRKIIIKSLEERNDYYYFNAFCLLRNEDRQFAVGRILEMWQGTKRVMPSIVFRELRDKFEKEERDFVLSHHDDQHKIFYDTQWGENKAELVIFLRARWSYGDFHLYAYCIERKTDWDYNFSQITKVLCHGVRVENFEKYILDKYAAEGLYPAWQFCKAHGQEISALVFIARADGTMRKPEREIIADYCAAEVDKCDFDFVHKYLQEMKIDIKTFNAILKTCATWENETKLKMRAAANALCATQKRIDPMERAAADKLIKALKIKD